MPSQDSRQTLDRWLKSHRGLVFKVVRAYASTLEDQDDLFQEIAVALWKSASRFRAESAETTWIYRVAVLTAMSWLRTETRDRRQPLDSVEHVLAAVEAPQDERLEWLYDEIRKLDPVDRSLTLLWLDGYSYREIAATVGVSESHVGVKIHRIKKRLSERLT